VTASGAVVGTPGYLAPEVLEGKDAGMPADVFSFGATLAYAATGRQPYGQGPASAVAYRVVHHEPDLEGVPEWLASLLRECLATDPVARPTAAQICARLGVEAAPRPRPVFRPPVRTALSVEESHDLETREWRPGRERHRRSVEESRARHREKVRRRWLVGSGLFVSLLAAAAREPVPEVALFLLAAYALGVVTDAGFALFSHGPFRTSRMIYDFAGMLGAVGLCLGLSAMFSTWTLVLFAGTALVVAVVFLLSA
jgi:hypothetical protein